MVERAETAVSALGVLGNTLRGISQKELKIAYLATVQLILTYGSLTWHTPGTQKTIIKDLERVQNKGLR